MSLEVTNESRGWHLHAHALVDTPWIDTTELSLTWGALVDQDFAIVRAKDCRDRDYLAEVTKYAVKSSQLSAWPGDDIATFIDAFTGVRQFSVFGTLFKDRATRAKVKHEIEPKKPHCRQCLSENLRYLDVNEEHWLTETGQWPALQRKW